MSDFQSRLKKLLKMYRNREISEKEIIKYLKWFPFFDNCQVTFDSQRMLRRRFPEFIYTPNKNIQDLKTLISQLKDKYPVILTRLSEQKYKKLKREFKKLRYNQNARIGYFKLPRKKQELCAVVSAGASDIQVAEEASFSLELLGVKVERIYDVGCAGLVRLISKIEKIESARCVIVVAGMEGALPGIIAGLISKPVIAVPTSVGYGVSLNGWSALLTMLNSCSLGMAVVNIDNGIGAATLAYLIIQS